MSILHSLGGAVRRVTDERRVRADFEALAGRPLPPERPIIDRRRARHAGAALRQIETEAPVRPAAPGRHRFDERTLLAMHAEIPGRRELARKRRAEADRIGRETNRRICELLEKAARDEAIAADYEAWLAGASLTVDDEEDTSLADELLGPAPAAQDDDRQEPATAALRSTVAELLAAADTMLDRPLFDPSSIPAFASQPLAAEVSA